jgi:hypothetical protein
MRARQPIMTAGSAGWKRASCGDLGPLLVDMRLEARLSRLTRWASGTAPGCRSGWIAGVRIHRCRAAHEERCLTRSPVRNLARTT